MAAGDTLVAFDALANLPPASNYATLALRGDFVVLRFSSSGNQRAAFVAVAPSVYSGNGVTCVVHYTTETATSGAALLRLSVTPIAPGESLESPTAAPQNAEATLTAPSAAGDLAEQQSLSMPLSSASKGQHFMLSAERLASDPSDTLADGLEIVSIELKES
ncbi:MAG: hypothetical protein AAGA92_12095 [Planctomycetota bacterium]